MEYESILKRFLLLGDIFFALTIILWAFYGATVPDLEIKIFASDQPPFVTMLRVSVGWIFLRWVLIGYWIPFRDHRSD